MELRQRASEPHEITGRAMSKCLCDGHVLVARGSLKITFCVMLSDARN